MNETQQQTNQECVKEIEIQQKKLQAEERSLVLLEFPHLKTRHDKAITECKQDMDNNIKNVNEFFELSFTMLSEYLGRLNYHLPC